MTAPSLTPLEALTVEAFGLTLDEELDFEVECAFPFHADLQEGCDGQAAKWMCVYPCCGRTGFLCAGRKVAWEAMAAEAHYLTWCSVCLGTSPCELFTFIPIGGTK